jgi:ribonuclease HI
LSTISLIFDGGFDRNGAYGSSVIFRDGRLVAYYHRDKYANISTSNQSEYFALITALRRLRNFATQEDKLEIFGDSMLVVRQLQGRNKVRNPALKSLYNTALGELARYSNWVINWWPRENSVEFFSH